MINQILNNISFKHSLWIISCLAVVYAGYWNGYFTATGIDKYVAAISHDKLYTSVIASWVLLFHLTLTYLGRRDRHKEIQLENDYTEAESRTVEVLKNNGLSESSMPKVDLFLEAISEDKVLIEWDRATDVDGLKLLQDELKAGPAKEGSLVVYDKDVSPDVIEGGVAFFGILIVKANSEEREEYEKVRDAMLAADKARAQATEFTRFQKIAGTIITLIFLVFLVFSMVMGNWTSLAPIAIGIILGWILAHSEKVRGMEAKAYYPYLVLLSIFGYAYYTGHRDGGNTRHSTERLEVTTSSGQGKSGIPLYMSTGLIVIGEPKTRNLVYINASEVVEMTKIRPNKAIQGTP